MNMGRFSELLERLKLTSLPKIKRIAIGTGAIMIAFFVILIISKKSTSEKPQYTKISIVPTDIKPKKQLDYEFIKFDTIKIPNFNPKEQPITEPPETIEPIIISEQVAQPSTASGMIKKSLNTKPTKIEPVVPEQNTPFQSRSANQNPNMIVTNNLAGNDIQSGSPATTFSGMQSVLLKVILPNRTPVAGGSLVEARVLRDDKWGNIFIPKRTKLIGVATFQNRRINIDFREILINNASRSCRGRAYDLKRLQGLPYSPVNSEAKRILVEELRDAVSGVPVLGRAANRATYATNYYDQDVSVLDEGLEFFVLIESIY